MTDRLSKKLLDIEKALGGSGVLPSDYYKAEDKLDWHLSHIEELIEQGGEGSGSGTQLVRITIMNMFGAPYYFIYDKGTLEEGLTEYSKDVGMEITLDNIDEIFATGNVYAKCMFWDILHAMPISFSYDGIPVLRGGINSSNLAYIITASMVQGEELYADFEIQNCVVDSADNWTLSVTPLYK